ncbi:hypothetical protein HPB50_018825 [Hyalomma asiaticum]|uniref:Uncharacterized protein n=1 Tax=Hyalomma asiaticum TaxID=266040 RepID=A0ACB7S127_HYAAI|nr:hypothetical protein HPB50_018825 [Hyalomma asiaticum]
MFNHTQNLMADLVERVIAKQKVINVKFDFRQHRLRPEHPAALHCDPKAHTMASISYRASIRHVGKRQADLLRSILGAGRPCLSRSWRNSF